MKIRISSRAENIYMASLGMRRPVNWEWKEKMKQIQGMTLEVETDHLFLDQYNTGPIPGVSDQGLRVMAHVVTAVIDDVRPGLQKCGWCGAHSPQGKDKCPKCDKDEYLEQWDLDLVKRFNPCATIVVAKSD